MSQQIDTALVQKYANAIEIGLQQKVSKLGMAVMKEVQNAEYSFHDRLGTSEMSALTTRHADTVYTDTPHSRRRIGLQHFALADLIDDKDKLQMNADPTSAYIQTFVAAANRKLDSLIIDAFDATVYTGKTGSTSVAFASDGGSTVAVDYVDGGGGSNSNLTIDKLREARRILAENEADEDELYFVMSPSCEMALLRNTETTSSDYNTIKALVNGEVNQFMGFSFVKSNQLDVASSIRDCYAFSRSAMKLVTAKEPVVRVEEVPTKNYSTQVYVSYSANALRMWGEKVVKVLADETK
jgi:hypothetical protein